MDGLARRVEKRDMIDGRAGTWFLVAICNRGWGWGAVCGWREGGEGLCRRELSEARERGGMECCVEMIQKIRK
jgi:hypothetical protein